jgi:hypothetical protein
MRVLVLLCRANDSMKRTCIEVALAGCHLRHSFCFTGGGADVAHRNLFIARMLC